VQHRHSKLGESVRAGGEARSMFVRSRSGCDECYVDHRKAEDRSDSAKIDPHTQPRTAGRSISI
jgi:hypothetical protein